MNIRTIGLTTLFASSLVAGSISVNNGWNLQGAIGDISSGNMSSSSCIKTLWTYTEGEWKLYHRDISDVTTYGYTSLSIIPKATGFWAKVDSEPCSISYSDETSSHNDSVTDFQRTLASSIAASSSGMAEVSGASSGATSSLSSEFTTATSSLGRVLYDTINPPTLSLDNTGGMSTSFGIYNANANLSMMFNVDSNSVDATHVMGGNSASFGLENMESTMQTLGQFFTQLATSTDPTTLISTNMPTIIPLTQEIVQAPLFSVVGDTALQDFFTSFPVDETSSYTADWNGLSSKFIAAIGGDQTNPNPNVNIDFSKIMYTMSLGFDSALSLGNIDMNFPSLSASGNLEQIKGSTGTIIMNFLGNSTGTVGVSGSFSGTISNVEINSTIDKSTGEFILDGKYDISVTPGDGNTYNGTATFDKGGCKGADIYDQNNNFVSRMQIFTNGTDAENGLWIVDESGQKLEKVQEGI